MRFVSSAIITVISVAILIIALSMSGCSLKQLVKRDPIPAQCNAICYTPCVDEDGDTGIRWVGNYTDPKLWDSLSEDVTIPLAEKLRQCETRRKACEQCLDRLEEQKVITQ